MTRNTDPKLDDLQARIDALKEKHVPAENRAPSKDAENMSMGVRAGTELIGAVFGGALIGYGLDRWLGTKPWLLIVFLLLGVMTGFMNIWKTLQGGDSAIGRKNMANTENKSLAKGDEPLK